jgi:hypothetical protein
MAQRDKTKAIAIIGHRHTWLVSRPAGVAEFILAAARSM